MRDRLKFFTFLEILAFYKRLRDKSETGSGDRSEECDTACRHRAGISAYIRHRCTFVTLDANSPHVIEYSAEHAVKTVHYMLRWQFKNTDKGPWGETVRPRSPDKRFRLLLFALRAPALFFASCFEAPGITLALPDCVTLSQWKKISQQISLLPSSLT